MSLKGNKSPPLFLSVFVLLSFFCKKKRKKKKMILFCSLFRFLENKDDIAKLRKSFAGLWSLDNSDIVESAMERPELYVLKPQREGGGIFIRSLLMVIFLFFCLSCLMLNACKHHLNLGNNIYGDDVRETLIKLKNEGGDDYAAYILMQRIFPKAAIAYLVRDGICHQDNAISELGVYGAYLR